jgi:hypothetical protein
VLSRRGLIVVLFLGIVALAASLPGGASATSQAPPRYSQGWLALNHTRYDTPITAAYEDAVRYGSKTLPGSSGKALAPDIVNRRMSNPSFAGNQNEFQIDINPRDHAFAIGASNDGRTSGTGYYRTSDGGRTWFAADMPGIGSSCCDPGIAYSAGGIAFFVNLDTSPAVAHVLGSLDNGVTWHLRADVPVEDRENIVVDNGPTSPFRNRVYLTWTDFAPFPQSSPDEIRLNYSDDFGATWSAPVNVSNVVAPGDAYPQSSQPRVANDGTVYVGFQYYPDGTNNSAVNLIAKSTNGGVSFQPAKLINGGPNLQGGLDISGDARGYFAANASCLTFRHRSFPIIGVDPANSQIVYATWAGGNLETPYSCGSLTGVHSDVLFSRSTDGGTTWSAPLKVNDDPSGKDQYYPWMDVAPNGTIWVGWHDRRDDPSNFKHAWYMDQSTDGGLTFGPDHRVADFLSQPSSFIGDYAGLAAEDGLVLPMWWDSRDTASGDPYTARIPR